MALSGMIGALGGNQGNVAAQQGNQGYNFGQSQALGQWNPNWDRPAVTPQGQGDYAGLYPSAGNVPYYLINPANWAQPDTGWRPTQNGNPMNWAPGQTKPYDSWDTRATQRPVQDYLQQAEAYNTQRQQQYQHGLNQFTQQATAAGAPWLANSYGTPQAQQYLDVLQRPVSPAQQSPAQPQVHDTNYFKNGSFAPGSSSYNYQQNLLGNRTQKPPAWATGANDSRLGAYNQQYGQPHGSTGSMFSGGSSGFGF